MIKVTFAMPQTVYDQIKNLAKTKDISVSCELRNLLEKSLKDQNAMPENVVKDELVKLAKLVEHTATLTQEIAYLTRYSVNKLPEESNDYHTENLKIFRKKAKETIENLMHIFV